MTVNGYKAFEFGGGLSCFVRSAEGASGGRGASVWIGTGTGGRPGYNAWNEHHIKIGIMTDNNAILIS